MATKIILAVGTVLVFGPSIAAAERPTWPVEVLNETLNVEGEVTAVIDGPVSAVLDEPVEVEGEVTIGNTVGVDVLSLPPSAAEPRTDFTNTTLQVVAGSSEASLFLFSDPLAIPMDGRLLFANVAAFNNGNARGCGVTIQFQRIGETYVSVGGLSRSRSIETVRGTIQLGGLAVESGEAVRVRCDKFGPRDEGNCICSTTTFFTTN